VIVLRFGMERLRIATLVPIVLVLVFLLGTHNGPVLDQMYSARTLATQIAHIQDVPPIVCVYQTRRDVQYGLGFYRNQKIPNYDADGIPPQEHILVVRTLAVSRLRQELAGRSYKPLFGYAPQSLVVYRVFAK